MLPAQRRLRSDGTLPPVLVFDFDVVLVDDSAENCIAAHDADFSARRASCGYHAPEEAETARRWGIPAISAEAVPELTTREAPVSP